MNAGGKGCDVPGVSSQGSVMQRIEAIIIGDGDISTRLQKNWKHVISLLADGIMQGRIPFRILEERVCVCVLLLCEPETSTTVSLHC